MIVENILLFLSGLVGHFYGTFSGGGAFLTIPALIFLGLAPQIAIATNRVATFGLVLGRFPIMRNKLHIGKKIPAFLILIETIGVYIGASILVSIDPAILFDLVGVIIILGAVFTYFSHKGLKEKSKKEITKKDVAITSFLLFFLGIYSGFFGPGAGTFGKIIMTNFLGLSFVQTVAFGTYSKMVSTIVAAYVFISAGLVDFNLALILGLGILVGSYFASKLAIEKGNVFVKHAFIFLAIIFGVYFLFLR